MAKPGSLLVRNTILNILGSVLPLLVGLVTIPYIIGGLGVERFGVLSLAWAVFTYFGMFDFGLSRATTKFVAEALGEGRMERLPTLVWTSLLSQIGLGVFGAAMLCALTPFAVDRILKIPPDLAGESRFLFYGLGLAIPFSITGLCLRGVLEAAQRFDLVNIIKIPLNASVFLMPAVAIKLGFRLPGVALLLLVVQFAGAVAFLVLSLRLFPVLRHRFSIVRTILRPLFSYGAWVTGYNLLIPVVMYLDRFLIGIMLSVGMVTYYTVPYEMVSRVQVLPASLATSLFPALSALGASRKEDVAELCARGMKYLLTVMGPLSLALVLFAGDILRVWLGQDFALKGTLVFQIVVIGFFLNSLAWPPTTVLLSLGRPDLVTKIYALILLVHAGLTWFLVDTMGLVGAALAVAVRGGIQVVFFFLAAWKVMSLSFAAFTRNGLFQAGWAAGTLVTALSTAILVHSGSGRVHVLTFAGLTLAFLFAVFRYVLNRADVAELQGGVLNIWGRLKR